MVRFIVKDVMLKILGLRVLVLGKELGFWFILSEVIIIYYILFIFVFFIVILFLVVLEIFRIIFLLVLLYIINDLNLGIWFFLVWGFV